jgi:hypothetical protein
VPKAVNSDPVVFVAKELLPTAVLFVPDVFAVIEFAPIAVF